MPDLNWYLPLERCRTLEEIHAQWDVLLEQNHMAPTYEAPAYQDALQIGRASCRERVF